MSYFRVLTALVSPILLTVPALAGPVSARALPDLVVKAVRTGTGTVAQGEPLTITATIANAGEARTGSAAGPTAS